MNKNINDILMLDEIKTLLNNGGASLKGGRPKNLKSGFMVSLCGFEICVKSTYYKRIIKAIKKQQQTIDEEIEVLSKAKIKELQNRWSSDYSKDELLFLENFYNKILATQNVSTPILQEYARDLCEIQLPIKKGLRAGADVKKDMDARDNIIKMAKFEASNSKNSADFDSVAELMLYYGRKGFHPKWHSEPQDSVDFCMKNIQSYLQRLVSNEGSLRDQVEEKRKIFNTTQRIEEMSDDEFQVEEETPIEYEDEDEAAEELSDWNG